MVLDSSQRPSRGKFEANFPKRLSNKHFMFIWGMEGGGEVAKDATHISCVSGLVGFETMTVVNRVAIMNDIISET